MFYFQQLLIIQIMCSGVTKDIKMLSFFGNKIGSLNFIK